MAWALGWKVASETERLAEAHQKHCCIILSTLRFADVPLKVL